jgi:hypothetical protein
MTTVLVEIPRAWKDGWPHLMVPRWRAAHQDLFSDMDVIRRDHHHQPLYGFPEWYGLASLMKYEFTNDAWKVERVGRLFDDKRLKWLRRACRTWKASPPDLLVYDAGRRIPLFFAEAKLGRDRVRANQRRFFAELFRKLGLGTTIFRMRLADVATPAVSPGRVGRN